MSPAFRAAPGVIERKDFRLCADRADHESLPQASRDAAALPRAGRSW